MPKLLATTFLLYAPLITAQPTGNWTQQLPANFPPPRSGAGMAYDSTHNQVVLFGGNNGQMQFGDTWVWDGSTWTQKPPIPSPTVRTSPAMTYDSVRGQVVLFGGNGLDSAHSSLVSLNDTWTFNGSQWTEQFPVTSPPALNVVPAMAFDAAHGQTIMILGDGFTTETWIWDGSNWSQKMPASSPPSSSEYAITYDSVHTEIVAWSNMDFSTWVWNGSNWTKMPSPQSPHASTFAEMADDAAHAEVILFSDLDQTWEWDGTSWSEESPQNVPTTNGFFSLAYDALHEMVVLFGGSIPGGNVVNNTWTWETGPTLPAISNVISASSFGALTAAAPGSWVEIYGTNLAPDTRQWTLSDFNGTNAPTSLDGVQVMIGGQKAFIDYISASPGQVNAQLPSNITTGSPLAITVSNANGTSQPFNITINAAEPGLLAPPAFAIGGKQYAVALLPDNATYILPTGAISGVTSRPAHAGETIMLYGIGFGPVTPNIPAGQIVGESNQLPTLPQVFFGQTAALVVFAGLVQGSVGLYQINVVVPSIVANNAVSLTFTLGGMPGTQTLYTAVQ